MHGQTFKIVVTIPFDMGDSQKRGHGKVLEHGHGTDTREVFTAEMKGQFGVLGAVFEK
jgi:hypothetical protein